MPFHSLEKVEALHDGYQRSFEVNGLQLLLIHQQGRSYLIENRCGHFGVPLDRATLYEQSIECNQHYIRFDLNNGEVLTPNAGQCDPLRIFETVIEDGQIGFTL
ncbi:hypothetical protein BOW53_06635 [Solemya pervernicosa gill symbiont]|uniref:Rieske domain-containing protein n=2 Tax=Gammaproteobacteria incertae sedis TaxID=118884 RepID=A0A1T2L6G6_9GAMM|nr:Rieske 2Fe-2S domain-containing protein [Candidatus Reidiella endopervernicosa]OOZ40683.1 hypothetical protein BOW53_06635 [Solemya pervernicosa gill symbiont]QKQ26746.1 Rieske 2Fe-2S domain-containing protein [Candidatus Reidiella endopervernicosa]